MLYSKFCLYFFPISKVVSLRKEVLNFRQLEEKSFSTSWDHFNKLIFCKTKNRGSHEYEF